MVYKKVICVTILILFVALNTSCSKLSESNDSMSNEISKGSSSDQEYLKVRKEFLKLYKEIGKSITASSAEEIIAKVQKDENKAKIENLKKAFGQMKEMSPEKGRRDFDTLKHRYEDILFLEEQAKIGLGKYGSNSLEIIKRMTIIDVMVSELKEEKIQ